MASVASQLIEEVTAHAQSDSLEDAREICADDTYFRITNVIIKNTQLEFYFFIWLDMKSWLQIHDV